MTRRTSITRAELDSNPKLALRLARRRGGVQVTDEDGNPSFRLSIPSTRLGGVHRCPTCTCAASGKRSHGR